MNQLNAALQVFTPIAYLTAIFAYRLRLAEDSNRSPKTPTMLVMVALICHFMWIFSRGSILGQAPWTTLADSLSALGFIMTLTYILVEMFNNLPSTGFDLLPVPFFLVTYSAAFGPEQPVANPILDSDLFIAHTVPAIGGMAAILVAGLYGLLYLRLERLIRRKDFGKLFSRLPNLESIAKMNFYACAVGLLLVTIAIGWGATWYGAVFEQVDITEPKIALTLIIWFVLLLPIIGRLMRRWTDRSTAILSVFTSLLVAISILITLLPFVEFHGHR